MSIKSAAMEVMKKVIEVAPDRLIPGGVPDPLIRQKHGALGEPVSRVDGPLKVSGAAPFAAEFPLDGMLYASVAFSTVAKGSIVSFDTTAAESAPGVRLVMTYRNAPKLKPMALFQSKPKAAGAKRSSHHAGCLDSLEWGSDCRGAGGNAGAGGLRKISASG